MIVRHTERAKLYWKTKCLPYVSCDGFREEWDSLVEIGVPRPEEPVGRKWIQAHQSQTHARHSIVLSEKRVRILTELQGKCMSMVFDGTTRIG